MTQSPDDAALVARLPDRLKMATQGKWMVQDGCSWRRIGTHEHDGDVLCPTVHPRDGHPDLLARDGKLYANLLLIVDAVNALPGLLDALEAKDRRIAEQSVILREIADYDPSSDPAGVRLGITMRSARAALEPSDKGVGR